MAIVVVQTQTVASGYSGSFGVNVTAGNTVFLVVTTYNSASQTISASSPTFGGGSVTGAAQLVTVQSPTDGGGNSVYTSTWMLPNLAGGAASFGITVTNGTVAANVGIEAYEVSGLGTSPAADKSSTGNAVSGTAVSSGASGAITQAPEIVFGSAVSFGQVLPGAGAPWTEVTYGAGFVYAGYQLPASSGGSYTYSMTAGGSATWCASVATVSPAVAASSQTVVYSMRMMP